MGNRIAALAGQWYLDRDSGSVFQIVSIDRDEESVEIQNADGSLEDTSFDDWVARKLEQCEQPEDWVGPFDDLRPDDIGLPECLPQAHEAETPLEQALLEIEERDAGAPSGTED